MMCPTLYLAPEGPLRFTWGFRHLITSPHSPPFQVGYGGGGGWWCCHPPQATHAEGGGGECGCRDWQKMGKNAEKMRKMRQKMR